MPAAYTAYKFKKMIGLVFILFILLIIFSLVNPLKNEAKDNLVQEISKTDSTGTAESRYNTLENIPDLESDTQQKSGGFLLNLLNESPGEFLLLVLVVAGILFLLGIRLKSMRGYNSQLSRSITSFR